MYCCSMAVQVCGFTGLGVAVRKWCCCNGCICSSGDRWPGGPGRGTDSKIAQGAVEDCFVPKREVAHRKSGQWHRILEKLFPGYVFVRTSAPEQVREVLGRVPAFTRMLTSAGDTCLPLTADEVAWINAITNVDTHVMEMSKGVIEGDRVMVTRGPLKGHEALIARIDRHKRLAWVDMDMFGRHKTIRVGLEIVSKK